MKERATRYIAIAGLILLVAGMFSLAVRVPGTRASWGFVIAGATLLAVTAFLNRSALVDFTRRRSARHGANAVLLTIFFTAVLVMVQAISVRNSFRADVTSDKRFTLAPQTQSVMRALEEDVSVLAFFRSNSPEAESVSQFLDRYAHESEHLRYEIVDPDHDPERTRALGVRYEQALVTSGDRRRVVATLDEQALTNAIVQVTRPTFKSLYFVAGHGEKSLASHDRDGFFHAAEGLDGEGYNVQELKLANVDRIPDDCEVLVIAGPRRAYLSGEMDKVDSYLDRGGAALFMLDPRLDLPSFPELLATYNIELIDAVVIDEMGAADGDRVFDATVTKVSTYVRHPITEGLTTMTTMFPRARPVRITEDSSQYRVTADYLAITEASSWGELDMAAFADGAASRDGTDLAGPLPIAAVAERKQPIDPRLSQQPPASRIVVIGDSEFASNAYYRVLGNADFFHNVVNYLAGDEDLISIRPRRGLSDRIYITGGQGRFIFLVVVVLLPLSSALVGATVAWRRR